MFSILTLVLGIAQAAPVQLAHSGRVLGIDGVPIEGTAQIRISLWPDADSADPDARVWTDLFTNVPVSGGFYQLALGSGATLQSELFSNDLWVQVTVNGSVLADRAPLFSVPRAAHVVGTVHLGDAEVSCDETHRGLMRYRNGTFEGCSDDGWVSLISGAAASATSCSAVVATTPDAPSAVYLIDPDGGGTVPPQPIFCDMDTPGGPWAVLQWDTSENLHANAHDVVSSTESGWSINFETVGSYWNTVTTTGFYVEVDGGPKYIWQDAVKYGTSNRPNVEYLFSGRNQATWNCNTSGSNGYCALTDQTTGRHWGRWANSTGCCGPAGIGGVWFYSQTAGGEDLNYGLCENLYPNGSIPSASGCDAGSYTSINPSGSKVFKLAIRN